MMRESRVLVVIGPSGVGKSSIFAALARHSEIEIFPTWTTRAPRHNENPVDADHVFVSDNEFQHYKQHGKFLDTVQLFGLDYWYGLPRLPQAMPAGKVPVIMLRAMLLERLAAHIPDFLVYQVEAPYTRVQATLKQREHQGGSLGTRLERYGSELEQGRRVANRIIDNSLPLESTVAKVRDYLRQDFAVSAEPA